MPITHLNIDGNDFTESISSDGFTIELALTDDGVLEISASDPIILAGNAYDHLLNIYQTTCGNTKLDLPVFISIECCDFIFDFLINDKRAFQFTLGTCEVALVLTSTSEAQDLFEALRARTFWQDPAYQQQNHARLKYFPDPNAFQVFNTNDWGSSKWHWYWHAPNVYDALLWNIETLNGGSFISQTVFDGFADYKRLAMTMSTFRHGWRIEDAPEEFFKAEKAPLWTTIDLLDKFAVIFNAEYRIRKDKTVQFERHDHFYNEAAPLMDLSEEIAAGNVTDSVTAEIDTSRNWAYGRFEWHSDAIDRYNRRVVPLFSDYIEWNPAGSELRSGERAVLPEFSPCHVISDEAYIRSYGERSGLVIGDQPNAIEFQIWDSISNNPLIGALNALQDQKMLWTSSGTTDRPILVILSNDHLDGTTLHANAESRLLGGDGNPYAHLDGIAPGMLPLQPDVVGVQQINWPLSFKQDEPNGLYQRFHAIDDPNKVTLHSIGAFVWTPEDFCDITSIILDRGLEVGFDTPFGKAVPRSIKIDFLEQSISFQDNTIREAC